MTIIIFTGQKLEARKIEFAMDGNLIVTAPDDDYYHLEPGEVIAIID